jgi:hypothetical protein
LFFSSLNHLKSVFFLRPKDATNDAFEFWAFLKNSVVLAPKTKSPQFVDCRLFINKMM